MSFGSLIATVGKFAMEDQSITSTRVVAVDRVIFLRHFSLPPFSSLPQSLQPPPSWPLRHLHQGAGSSWPVSGCCHRKNLMRHFDIHNLVIHTWYSTSRFCRQWCLRPTFAFSASFSLNPRTSCQQAKVYNWSN